MKWKLSELLLFLITITTFYGSKCSAIITFPNICDSVDDNVQNSLVDVDMTYELDASGAQNEISSDC